MATLTAEDIRALIEAAVKGTIEGQKKTGREGGSLDEIFFSRVKKFDGKEGTWNKWSFQFKTQVGVASKFTRDTLDEIQKAGGEVDFDSVLWRTKKKSSISLVPSCTVCSRHWYRGRLR